MINQTFITWGLINLHSAWVSETFSYGCTSTVPVVKYCGVTIFLFASEWPNFEILKALHQFPCILPISRAFVWQSYSHLATVRGLENYEKKWFKSNQKSFNVHQSYCARYSYIGWTPVRPSHIGIVSKRLNISSNCLHCLVAPWF